MIDRSAPAHRPPGRPGGFQRWRHLLFLHWPVEVAALRPLVPAELAIDTFEGRAFVGVVPFTMRDVTTSWTPAIPGVSNFHELNVRTYVICGDALPGIWFFSLDAASSLAVIAARAGWGLPYHRASMRLAIDNGEVRYASRRLWPGPKPADLELTYRIGEELGPALPDTLEHFLVERYLLLVDRAGMKVGQVHHRPYPLRRAAVTELRESVVRASGMPAPTGAPHVLYCSGVDVDVYALRTLGALGALGAASPHQA